MILIDFGSVYFRSLMTSISTAKPHKKNGNYVTSEYIDVVIYRIISELLETYKNHKNEFGNLVICIDDASRQYWRKTIYPYYKNARKHQRDILPIDFNEVFKHINLLVSVLTKYTPFKSVQVPGAEADDVIGFLTKKYAPFEKILIWSPDKDFKQFHNLGYVKQYSSITNDWIVAGDLSKWIIKHCCLGDAIDGVPKITDFLRFSDSFRTYLNGKYNELEFYKLPYSEQDAIIEKFDVFKKNRKGELTETKDVYDPIPFGEAKLFKTIEQYGSLENWLDSNEILKAQYEINKKLVLDLYVPQKIESDILNAYLESPTDFDFESIKKYLDFYKLGYIANDFKRIFTDNLKTVKFSESKNLNFNLDSLIF